MSPNNWLIFIVNRDQLEIWQLYSGLKVPIFGGFQATSFFQETGLSCKYYYYKLRVYSNVFQERNFSDFSTPAAKPAMAVTSNLDLFNIWIARANLGKLYPAVECSVPCIHDTSWISTLKSTEIFHITLDYERFSWNLYTLLHSKCFVLTVYRLIFINNKTASSSNAETFVDLFVNRSINEYKYEIYLLWPVLTDKNTVYGIVYHMRCIISRIFIDDITFGHVTDPLTRERCKNWCWIRLHIIWTLLLRRCIQVSIASA